MRNTLTEDQIKDWLNCLSGAWNGVWRNEESTRAYNNDRNFLRSLYLYIFLLKDKKVPNEEMILKLVQKTTEQARPWAWET